MGVSSRPFPDRFTEGTPKNDISDDSGGSMSAQSLIHGGNPPRNPPTCVEETPLGLPGWSVLFGFGASLKGNLKRKPRPDSMETTGDWQKSSDL